MRSQFIRLLVIVLLAFMATASFIAYAQKTTKNGFLLANSQIPIEEIFSGGPPKDGIPAIDNPKFLSVKDAKFLQPTDKVLGVHRNGIAKAYPIRILDWHEIVNDQFNNEAIAITYCPLCGTGVAFEANVKGDDLRFGVSGLLYNSDVLLYDRRTESLWSQILSQAVTGNFSSTKLTKIPLVHTTWQQWKKQYPDTQVLSTDTGFHRDYNRSPYAGYEESQRLFFSVSHPAPSHLHPKERVLGIDINGVYKAYPYSELSKNNQTSFTDEIAGKSITVHWDEVGQSAKITTTNGEDLAAIQGFWFAWYTFHPETTVYSVKLP